jgi:hypothetical protein
MSVPQPNGGPFSGDLLDDEFVSNMNGSHASHADGNGEGESLDSSSDAIDLTDEVSVLDLDADDDGVAIPTKAKKVREGENEDYYFQHEWPKHKKHIFILSNSGKPVYSRLANLHFTSCRAKPVS